MAPLFAALVLASACGDHAPPAGDAGRDGGGGGGDAGRDGGGGGGDAGRDGGGGGGDAGRDGGGGGGAGRDGGGGGGMVCGSGTAGTFSRTINHAGLDRNYKLHVPEGLTEPVPIVFVHHGFTMSGQIMIDITDFEDLADREGFIAVFPDAYNRWTPWEVGADVGKETCAGGPQPNPESDVRDDIGFVMAMLAEISSEHCVAEDEVFVTGFSMGGYFTNHIACEEGDMLRAAAPHSGGTYSGACDGAPVPIMILHGDDDAIVPYSCGTGARDYWVARNGCSDRVETVAVEGGHCEYSEGCPTDGPVVLCVFDGMPHGWAGTRQSGLGLIYGGGDQYENAAELIWKFFKSQL